MLQQQRLRSDGAHATWADAFHKGDQQVDGEDEEVAQGGNRIMAARARKTAPHRRVPSYCEFATHRSKRPTFHPSDHSSNRIFRISCSNSVRRISRLLAVTMTTGQITGYKSGQLKSSQHW
jgi:hypothetical protein